jgi:hypothetical protein
MEVNQMMRFKHKRQQWPVGHGFFHTASIMVNGATYRYVYDCGAGKKATIEKQVDRYFRNEELEALPNDLDMVVISHFHADHIKGINHLFAKFNIKKLVIPHLADNFKLVALAHLAASGPAVWEQLSGLVINPVAWVSAQGQDTEIIEISDENGERLDVAPTVDGSGISLGGSLINHSTDGAIYSQGKAFWSFKFYVENSPVLTTQIINSLVSEFRCNKQQLSDWLHDPTWVKANWSKVKYAFKALGSPKQNATTLSMYSGTKNLIDIVWYTSSQNNCHCIRHYYRAPLDRIGWLGTGDAELKDSSKLENFEKHFKDFIHCLDTLTIPHHGSRDNYNARLGDFGFQHIITSDHLVDPKDHHPAAEVMLNLQTKSDHVHIVSLKDCTAVFESFDGLLKI